MRPSFPRGVLALAGVVGGAAVGLVDGLRAGLLIGADARGLVASALLAAGMDALLGGIGGGLAELVARLAVWGRRGRPVMAARAGALVVAGGVAAAATAATVVGLALRRNRFLAGGVVMVVAAAVALCAALLVPALARLLSGRQPGAPAPARVPSAALLVLAPLAVVAVDRGGWGAGGRARPPLGPVRVARLSAIAAAQAALLPALLHLAEAVPLRPPLRWTAALAAVGFGAPAAVAVATSWSRHLRFIPWTHVVVAVLLAAATLAAAVPLARRLWPPPPVRRRAATLAAALGAGMLLVLVASESEPARKAVAARAGLVGPALATAQRSLDRDDDGAPRLLGGGDCDDGDPAIHPGALDFPDDGLDEDCDGRDATVTVLEPPPFAPVPAAVPRDLNLLFVTIDTLRADHLGCYGYARPTSPVIDRLAAEGALFENGWAHAPSTRYSMPAIATGRWPSAIAWDESIWWPRIAPGVRTVGEALKAAGYHTGAIYSYDYFAPRDRRGFERGIDHYRADRAVLHQAVNGPMESRGSSSREVTDDAMAFVEAARQGKFFLWVHYYDPHLSYDPHPEVPPFGGSRVDRYDGEIRFTDLHLGRLLDRLRSLGLWERTAVILTGDHGEGFGEHGVNEHGFDLYAPQTKVPLVVRVPGLAPRRVRAPAGHVDLAPTMLNLARAAREPAFLGRSLLPELTGTATGPARPLFQEVSSERGKKRALVTERLHVIWNWTPENTTECYDLAADPEERRDLWGRRSAEGCTRLRHELGAMVSALSVPSGFGEQLARAVFPPGRALPALPVSVAASVGGVAKVLGYGPTGAGAVVAAGAPVEMSHLFESTRRIPPGWRFYFHLVGPDGSFQNLDHIPVGGAMPPERWRPGQRILDQHRFTVPSGMPPGRYQLVVGMFRGGERMKIEPRELSDGQDGLKTVSLDVR